jgi:signal transduction histidine kinase
VVNPLLREKGIKSMLGAPLIVEDRIIGVVHVGTLSPRTFPSHDVHLLQIVADRVALAIDRATAYEELVRLTEIQRDFVALAAHELRTPTTTIYGLAATLQERGDQVDDETLHELRSALYMQADRMRRLVDQLLDLSRIDAKRVRITRERVRLRPQLEEIVASIAGDRSSEVTVEAASELEVDVDPNAIERVVSNLLTNALRYGAPPVIVQAEHKDQHIRIRVEDSGAGVASEFAPFLFDRFRRSEQSRQRGGGIGLGLAIARSYAHAHGGDLLYAPRHPTGASFELVLPAEPNDTQAHFWRR